MKKLKLLCMLTFALVLFSSCRRVATSDAKVEDYGVITQLSDMEVSIHSMLTDSMATWYLKSGIQDGFEFETNLLKVNDTVYIYHDGNAFFASKYSVNDAKAVNKALSQYYYQNVIDNWYWILLAVLLMAFFGWGYYISSYPWKHENFWPIPFGCLILICAFLGLNGGCALYPVTEGTITKVSENMIVLDHNRMIGNLASMKDIQTQKPVQAGSKVSLYKYVGAAGNPGKIFISSKTLQPDTIRLIRIYPEIFLKTTFGIVTLALAVMYGLRTCKKRLVRRKKSLLKE